MNISQLRSKINEIFEAKGVNSRDELTSTDKDIYDSWMSAIEEGEMTVDKIKKFCESQIRIIEGNYATGARPDKEDYIMRACLHVYLNLLKLINSPEMERENIEKELNNLIK